MRPSLALLSKEFGELADVRRIVTYKLSPHEQRAFAGLIFPGFANTIRRIKSKILIVAPPFVIAYLVYSENTKEHQRLMRKNLDDYKDDK